MKRNIEIYMFSLFAFAFVMIIGCNTWEETYDACIARGYSPAECRLAANYANGQPGAGDAGVPDNQNQPPIDGYDLVNGPQFLEAELTRLIGPQAWNVRMPGNGVTYRWLGGEGAILSKKCPKGSTCKFSCAFNYGTEPASARYASFISPVSDVPAPMQVGAYHGAVAVQLAPNDQVYLVCMPVTTLTTDYQVRDGIGVFIAMVGQVMEAKRAIALLPEARLLMAPFVDL